MAARTLLARLVRLRQRKEKLIEEYEQIQNGSLTGVRYDKERVQTNGSGSAVERSAIRLSEIRSEFVKVDLEYTNARLDLSELICKLSYEQYKIITSIYIYGKNLEVIARELGRSKSTIDKWHNAALDQLDRIYGDVIADGEL